MTAAPGAAATAGSTPDAVELPGPRLRHGSASAPAPADRVVKVAQTIADLEGAEHITAEHLAREPHLPRAGGGPQWVSLPPGRGRCACGWARWRPTVPGFIGQLVLRYRTTAQVLAQPPGDIAEFALRRRRGGRTGGGRGSPRLATPAEDASDAARFAAVLAAGPRACLERAERRPPGDLVVAWSEPLYPDQLRDLGDPPLCLFVRGGAEPTKVRARVSAIVDAPLVAVVGTRRPSPYGLDMARGIARDLARAGLIVVSGMALGVDAAAQKAVVDAEVALSPATVAVLGCGADIAYPRSNARLYGRPYHAYCGLVVSEFAWGRRPAPGGSRPVTG